MIAMVHPYCQFGAYPLVIPKRSEESPPSWIARGLGGCLPATSPPRHPLRSRFTRPRPLALKLRGRTFLPLDSDFHRNDVVP